jgi:hypothetical protein
MKTISMMPKLNEAYKVVQPLPALTSIPPVDLHRAAAPRFDVTWRVTEATRHPTRALALDAAENGAGERSRRLSAVAAFAGIVQSCATMADLPSQGNGSPALEVSLIG